jgi:hypothetical protein
MTGAMQPRRRLAQALAGRPGVPDQISNAPVNPVAPVDPMEGIYTVPGADVGNSDGQHTGQSYGEMSPQDFNQAAQDRANAGWAERNLPSMALPAGLGFLGGMMDDSAFEGEQDKRSAQFAGAGQMMPDELMGQGGGAPGGYSGGWDGPSGGMAGMDVGAQSPDQDMAAGFAEGGLVTPDRLLGPNPPGPDDGFVALDVGEVVLNPRQQRKVGMDRIARALMGARTA